MKIRTYYIANVFLLFLGERQIVSLVKIRAFYQDANLIEPKQKEIRDKCLELWKVPNNVRRAPQFEEPQTSIRNLLGPDGIILLNSPSTNLTPKNITECVKVRFYFIQVWRGMTDGVWESPTDFMRDFKKK